MIKMPYNNIFTLPNTDTNDESQNQKSNGIFYDCLSISLKYYSAGILNIIEAADSTHKKDIIEDKIRVTSRIFKDITTIPIFKGKSTTKDILDTQLPDCLYRKEQLTLPQNNDIAGFIRNIINSHQQASNPFLLRIDSPVGSYKNRLLQLITLSYALQQDNIVPLYLDVSRFESDNNTLLEDLKRIETIAKSNQEKAFLLVLDNYRLIHCGQEDSYTALEDILSNISLPANSTIIIGGDEYPTINKKNKRLPLFKFDCVINITSINLSREQESIDFIQNCLVAFNIKHDDLTAEDIRKLLIGDSSINSKLQFYSLDAFELKYILDKIRRIQNQKEEGDPTSVMIDLFKSIELDSNDLEFAYRFEYGNPDSYNSWKKFKEHRIFLEYAIARYYSDILASAIKPNQSSLSLPNVVFPKNITRFLVEIINYDLPSDLESIVNWIGNNFSNNSKAAQSQLAFILGRIFATKVNPSILTDILNRMMETAETNKKNEKMDYFLLRSINVSLIYLGDQDKCTEYIKSLIHDEIADSINRGFHLDYYEDISTVWNPAKDPVNLEDDTNKGWNTFRKIIINIENTLNANPIPPKGKCILMLQVVTLCMLLKARDFVFPAGSTEFTTKCIVLTEKYLANFDQEIDDDIKKYLRNLINAAKMPNADFYIKAIDALSKPRTGWVERNIPNAETIEMHMYHCFLIGVIFLPHRLEKDASYDKQLILALLSIHDLSEIEIGDIVSSQKTPEQKEKEGKIFVEYVSSFYESDYADKLKTIWLDAESTKPENINAKILKDIDRIQRTYQYLVYRTTDSIPPNHINDKEWLEEIEDSRLLSDLGKRIKKKLITDNKQFHCILNHY